MSKNDQEIELEELEIPALNCDGLAELDWGQTTGRGDHEVYSTSEKAGELDMKWERCGVVAGMSELDFMSRQRYLDIGDQAGFIRSQTSLHSQRRPTSSSSAHKFIQEQRKIIRTFKAQPWSMRVKMTASRHYKSIIRMSEPEMNSFDSLVDRAYQVYRWGMKRGTDVREGLTIGNRFIKSIEGRFGSSVASFFTFLRWLCMLNLYMTLLVLGFIVVPQVLAGHGLDVPPEAMETRTATSFVFDGKGTAFEYSVLFYGFYDSGEEEPYSSPPANPRPYIGLGYKLPLAYILAILSLFVISTAAILMNMAEKYKLLQRGRISEQYPFSWKVFAGWDHAITHKETAQLKSCHITNSLKETINEMEKVEGKHNWKKIVIRVITNMLIVLVLGGSSYCIVLAVENSEQSLHVHRGFGSLLYGGLDGLWNLILSFQVQVVVIARNFILPWVFLGLEYLERHHPRTALKLMLVRMFLMYTTSLYVMIIALLTVTQLCGTAENIATNTSSGYVVTALDNTTVTSASHAVTGGCCWETTVGQEFYKLSWSHLGAEFGSLLAADVLRYLIVCIKPFRRFGPAEFNLANNILKLVYGQALVWMGVLFCPLLPSIMLVKCFCLFYIRVYVVRYLNRPPRAMFKVASTRSFYMLLLLLMVFLCVFPVGYASMRMLPSSSCGPFRGLSTMMQIIDNEMATWADVVQLAIEYIKTSSVLIPLFSLLCVIIYYYASLSHTLKDINKDLILQLHVERTDARERVAKESIAKRTAHEEGRLVKGQIVTNSHQFSPSTQPPTPRGVVIPNQGRIAPSTQPPTLGGVVIPNQGRIAPSTQPPTPRGVVIPNSSVVVNHVVVDCD